MVNITASFIKCDTVGEDFSMFLYICLVYQAGRYRA